ncbi:MAG: PadR family transcriptional regulator [Gemmatimonadota bacterium]
MDPQPHLPLSPRDFLILLVLVDGPLHGWGIVKAVEERVGEDVPIDPANLYRSMKRLQRDGIAVEAERPDGEAPAEQRRYFQLTELGRAVVAAEASRLARLTDVARGANLVPPDLTESAG